MEHDAADTLLILKFGSLENAATQWLKDTYTGRVVRWNTDENNAIAKYMSRSGGPFEMSHKLKDKMK